MKALTNNPEVKNQKGVRMVTKKKVAKKTAPKELMPLNLLCGTLVEKIDSKLKGKNSWGMTASLYGARSAVSELIQALPK